MPLDLILWTDAPDRGDDYVRRMDLARALRRDAHLHRSDYAIAVAMAAAAVVVLVTHADVDALRPSRQSAGEIVEWAATLGVCLVMVGRSRWPLTCLAVILVLLFALGVTGNGDSIAYAAMLIALYSAAATLPGRRCLMAAAMLLALVAIGQVALHNDPTTGMIGAGAAFALGRMIRARRRRQDDEAAGALHRANVSIEIAELEAAEDRQRMAQELHDIVAHSLSVIAVRAGIAVHLIDREPAEAALALDAIRVAGRAASTELERLIILLRDGEAGEEGQPPSLADVAQLCADVTAASLPVRLTTTGDLDAVPAGVSLAAYRIVQEALTNVVRHAGRASADVAIAVTTDRIDILVEDDGAGRDTPVEPDRSGAGHGLVGMTQRARMYGGTVSAGPRPTGGFRVCTVLATSMSPVETPVVTVAVAERAPDMVRWQAAAARTAPAWVWDLALAALFVAIAALHLLERAPSDGPTEGFAVTDGWAWALEIGCCVAVAGRRRCPATSLLVSAVLGVALTIGDYDTAIIVVVFVVGLYSVGSWATTPRFVAALVGIVVVMSIVAWSDPPDLDGAGAVWTAMVSAAAAVTGYVVRRDRERRDARTADHHSTGVDESRRARLTATTERLRVAEELDRVITCSIASISVAADEGARVVATDPLAALGFLETVSGTSRDALGELRRVLRHMHAEGAAAAPHAPARTRDDAPGPT